MVTRVGPSGRFSEEKTSVFLMPFDISNCIYYSSTRAWVVLNAEIGTSRLMKMCSCGHEPIGLSIHDITSRHATTTRSTQNDISGEFSKLSVASSRLWVTSDAGQVAVNKCSSSVESPFKIGVVSPQHEA